MEDIEPDPGQDYYKDLSLSEKDSRAKMKKNYEAACKIGGMASDAYTLLSDGNRSGHTEKEIHDAFAALCLIGEEADEDTIRKHYITLDFYRSKAETAYKILSDPKKKALYDKSRKEFLKKQNEEDVTRIMAAEFYPSTGKEPKKPKKPKKQPPSASEINKKQSTASNQAQEVLPVGADKGKVKTTDPDAEKKRRLDSLVSESSCLSTNLKKMVELNDLFRGLKRDDFGAGVIK